MLLFIFIIVIKQTINHGFALLYCPHVTVSQFISRIAQYFSMRYTRAIAVCSREKKPLIHSNVELKAHCKRADSIFHGNSMYSMIKTSAFSLL